MKTVLALIALALPGVALAAQDYSSVTTALTAEVTAVLPVALGLFALVAGVFLGVRIIKRFAKG